MFVRPGLCRSAYPGDHPSGSREHGPPKGTVTMSHSRTGSRIMGSPLETSGAKPRKLWPTAGGSSSSGTPGPAVRVELSGVGSLSTRKSLLEGINSMVSGRGGPPEDSTPSSHGSSHSSRGPPSHPHYPPPTVRHPGAPPVYRGDMTTPIKTSGHLSRPAPGSAQGSHHPYHHPGSASKPHYPHSAPKAPYPGSAQKTPYPAGGPQTYPESVQKMRPSQKIPPSTGKENKNKKPSSPKRTPCNCKKSRCLKLYCECFAAELFCEGCNCADCGNTPTAGQIREKAIKDTRAKNPNAFKPRIGVKPLPGTSPQSGHNMGCRCKRSECLKKYCEVRFPVVVDSHGSTTNLSSFSFVRQCFQAGVICGNKCKCVECLNYAGSQALIDKRRKIKDQRGADFAMRVADEAWKGQPGGPGKPGGPPSVRRPPPVPSPGGARLPHPHMMHPSPRGPPPPGSHHPPPHYMHQGMMMGPPMGHMGYSPMGIPMTPAGYPHPQHMAQGEPHHSMYPPPPGNPSAHRPTEVHPPPKITPTATPRTPAVRVRFDPASSRKKRKLSPGVPEPTFPYFGEKLPEQPKTTALAIFSFLSNDDLYNAGLVCKKWTQIAMDGELWKFQT